MNPPTAITPPPHPRARVAALAIAATILLVPANILPVVSTNTTGQARTDTIFTGVIALADDGMWGIAAIVFTASILIPFLKLFGIAWLIWSTRHPRQWTARRLTRLYAVLNFIGRWSMLDVFLVAFLSGVVKFGVLADVEPRPGILAFAGVVVLTILATDAFDPRLLWAEERSTTAAP
jgi:paraquat-inducible protein A